jgi:cytochrome c oxidase cbb3-type subunit 1
MNEPGSTSNSAARCDAASVSEIDASCRAPLFVLFSSAVTWLLVSSFFGLIASLKFHKPDFLSNCAWLTYGRVHPVATNALVYGFAVQAGLGVGLWIIARLGQTKVVSPCVVAIGGKLWNLGVLVGLIGIFMGDSTGFENLEMPRYAAAILFLAYLIIGVCVALTFHSRQGDLEPSQWYLLAALFWFPWIYTTANLLLSVFPVRGVMQAVVAWWYSANLNLVWMGLSGLAALFYFLPVFTKRVLHSHYLALFTFWTIILFASWSGIPPGAPVPAWMPSLSAVATILTVVAVLSVVMNLIRTAAGSVQPDDPLSGKFIAFGAAGFVIAWLMNIIGFAPGMSPIINFTWFTTAQSFLNVYGFFAMTMFAAIYYIVPRVSGLEWPRPSFVRAHFWLAAAGTLLIVVPLALGGIIQGNKLNNPEIPFLDIARGTLMFFRISTLGELLILAGHLLLAINLFGLLSRYTRNLLMPAYREATVELKPAEAKP